MTDTEPDSAPRFLDRFRGTDTIDRRFPLFGIVALFLVVNVVFAESVAGIVAIWNNDGFRHGYLIPLVFAFLLWHQRDSFAHVRIQPSWSGTLLVVAGVWLWLLSRQTMIQVAEHLAVLSILHALAAGVLGWRVYWRAFFALSYLALAIPAGTASVPWLMELTANLSHVGLRMMGIPVLRDELFFVLSGGSFEVAEACSGFRYVFSGLALSLLVAHLDLRGWWMQCAFVLVAVASFVLLNSVRATLIMAIASATDMKHLATDHEWFGWLLFVIVFLALYAIAQRFGRYRGAF